MDLALSIRRDKRGDVSISGKAQPRDMTLKFRDAPYALEQVRGEVEFDGDRVLVHNVTARHGTAKFSVDGAVQLTDGMPFDLTIAAQELGLDNDLEKALPPAGLSTWRQLSPGGLANMSAHLWRTPGDERSRLEMTAKFDVMSNRLSLAIIVASIIIGTALIAEKMNSSILTRVPVVEMGFVVAMVLGLFLAYSILRSGKF
jgi:hypothetical protein